MLAVLNGKWLFQLSFLMYIFLAHFRDKGNLTFFLEDRLDSTGPSCSVRQSRKYKATHLSFPGCHGVKDPEWTG